MQRTNLGPALACAAAAVLAVGLTSPASAARTDADYVLSVEFENSGEYRQVSLDCDPEGGTHPKAQEACDLIEEHGSIEAVPAENDQCTMEYNPVKASSIGWEEYSETFSNPCLLGLAKGEVFDF
ncbi:SSI family serine proteinase inhibitor [Nocardiopsis salina]|uniref:SSI family serine proteinase inhibitor n=1 Tax=Nocardiopsis salina TaxID=245836 RepID=UPI00034C1BA2|nr:SSI family serine proteinase inhibitor [Nocardiopsis salina]